MGLKKFSDSTPLVIEDLNENLSKLQVLAAYAQIRAHEAQMNNGGYNDDEKRDVLPFTSQIRSAYEIDTDSRVQETRAPRYSQDNNRPFILPNTGGSPNRRDTNGFKPGLYPLPRIGAVGDLYFDDDFSGTSEVGEFDFRRGEYNYEANQATMRFGRKFSQRQVEKAIILTQYDENQAQPNARFETYENGIWNYQDSLPDSGIKVISINSQISGWRV